jgi:hypothetical protein
MSPIITRAEGNAPSKNNTFIYDPGACSSCSNINETKENK